MSEKYANPRQKEILNLLLTNNNIQVAELADKLNVTQATIRRDLTKLESLGKLYRTHGGAILKEQTVSWLSTTLEERMKSNIKEKEDIAKSILPYIEDSETIMMDGGSTTMAIAKELAQHKQNLLIITNCQAIGDVFIKDEDSTNNVYIIGGELLYGTQNTVGPIAERNLDLFKADKSIISITGVLIDEGLFTASPQESEIKRLMIKNSKTNIIVFGVSKIGVPALSKCNNFENIDLIITNKDIELDHLNKLKTKVSKIKLA